MIGRVTLADGLAAATGLSIAAILWLATQGIAYAPSLAPARVALGLLP